MRRLIYTSTAVSLMNERALGVLLADARLRNKADNLTGLLIYHEGCFFQILEGREDMVEACFDRIGKDNRHNGCILLADDRVSSRMFADWWMAHRQFADMTTLQQKQFVELSALAKSMSGQPGENDTKAHAILLAFLSTFRDLELEI